MLGALECAAGMPGVLEWLAGMLGALERSGGALGAGGCGRLGIEGVRASG